MKRLIKLCLMILCVVVPFSATYATIAKSGKRGNAVRATHRKNQMAKPGALLVDTPSINGYDYLLTNRFVKRNTAKMPLVFGGKLEAQIIYNRSVDRDHVSDIDLNNAELDAFAKISPLVHGFMAVTYDNMPSQHGGIMYMSRRIDNSNIKLDKGYLMLGNPSISDFSATIGQLYVPFGRYDSNMIADPLTKLLGRTKARAIVLNYAQKASLAPYAHLFTFKGDSLYGNNKDVVKQYGADAGMVYKTSAFNVDFGASYINNIADSTGIQTVLPLLGGEEIGRKVSGADAHMNIGLGPISVFAEYVTALRGFENVELKPHAYNVEGAYQFNLMNLNSSIALGYGNSKECSEMLPKERYLTTFAVNFTKNLIGKLEYRHDSFENQGIKVAHDNVVTGQIGIYF